MEVWSLSQEDTLEKKMATCSSILAWKIPQTGEPGGLQSVGSQRVRHAWAHMHTHTRSLGRGQGLRANYMTLRVFPQAFDSKLHIKRIMINGPEMTIVLGTTARNKECCWWKYRAKLNLLFIVAEKVPSHSLEHGVLSLMVLQWVGFAENTHSQKFLDAYSHTLLDPASYFEEIIFADLT